MLPINLHISSNGGDLIIGLAFYDYIKNNKYQINTYVDGYCASAASLIFLGGKERFMSENSFIMIHQLSTLVMGTFSNVVDEYQNCNKLMEKMKNIYRTETSIDEVTL